MKKILLIGAVLLTALTMQAQELLVNVTVNTPKLQTADPKVFNSLETAIEEFMNNQRWTDDTFEEEERIKVEMVLTISDELGPTQFRGELAIQSTRPIFGTTDETPLLNHLDKDFLFEYEQFQPLEYTENLFQNNLTTVLSFYAFIVLGMDYDSFSPFGGEQYFQTAQEIINNVPPNASAVYKGWRSVDSDRNRYWIAENMLSNRLREYRQAVYDYHRQGLDIAYKDFPTGRAIMANAIKGLGMAEKAYPRSMVIQMFSNAKSAEIIDIFKGGVTTEKNDVIAVMQRIDASKASNYRAIK